MQQWIEMSLKNHAVFLTQTVCRQTKRISYFFVNAFQLCSYGRYSRSRIRCFSWEFNIIWESPELRVLLNKKKKKMMMRERRRRKRSWWWRVYGLISDLHINWNIHLHSCVFLWDAACFLFIQIQIFLTFYIIDPY